MEKTAPLYGVAIIDEEETEALSLEGQHMPHALHAEALGSVQAKMQVPDENELRASILRIMQQHTNEGEDINIKKIRQIIEKEQNCDLSERKQWVRETVHALIAEHFADDEDEDDETVKNREAILPIPTSQEMDKKSSVTTAFHETLCENPQACAETDDTTSSQSAPGIRLMAPSKTSRGWPLLVQLNDSRVDFQNDTGVIGRVSAQKRALTMDLKGHRFTGHIRPCASLLVVGVTGGEAKVEAIMDEFCELSDQTNIVEQMSGRLIRGTMSKAEDDEVVYGHTKKGEGNEGGNKKADKAGSASSRKKQKREV